MSDDERERPSDDNVSEAKLRMEQELKKRQERAEEEWAEYEEIRKVQREKEQEDIQALRERREKRKKEREEEEKRLAELRAQEEQKRRAEEEERQRRKREDENQKKEARDRKRLEAEQRTKNIGKPNFTIGKRADTDSNQEEVKEEKVQKTKEQLEAERKAALEQRFHELNTAGFNIEQFRQKAKELHQLIYKLESEKYDLKKRFEQQNYDMMELSEKARQMNKGGTKNAKVNVSQTPDPLASKMSGVPPKITMYSQYERVKDHRPFTERREVFSGPLYSDEYQRIEPEHKVVMTEQGARFTEGSNEGGHAKENEAPVQNGLSD
jgi:chromosome segregation ATPase